MLIKTREMPRHDLERLILRERCSGRPLEEQEDRIDEALRAYTFWSGWTRMWRYIGQHRVEHFRTWKYGAKELPDQCHYCGTWRGQYEPHPGAWGHCVECNAV